MNQFGGGAQDDYGYFAPTRVSGGTDSQFGAAGAPAGAPTYGSVGGFGGAGPYAAPPAGRAGLNPKAKGLLAVVVLAVLVVGSWFAWNTYQLSRELVLPGTLSAMSPVSTPQVGIVKTQVQKQWESQYPNVTMKLEVYAGHKQAVVLALARGKSDVEGDFADIGYTGQLQPVGDATCAVLDDSTVACERASRTLSVFVIYFKGSVHDAAAALDEAWQLQ